MNAAEVLIDMTSFEFVLQCGSCHPGGGPLEFDRDGERYDRRMLDPASGMEPGGKNGLDGDYYKARWGESGVLEGDCLLCHFPDYDFDERERQLGLLNFRWAATAGSRFGRVEGAVKDGEVPRVGYASGLFEKDGKVSPHIVRTPRNETCLHCHAKPGWKKRGANFRSRTDVHLRAGLLCVDCHPAGASAVDSRIDGKEAHQIGKGDDPSQHVRDDLDDTCRDCTSCHADGYLGAPISKHSGLPPLHLTRIACQTCHIPERAVAAVQLQASDVINPGSKIPTAGKHLWTFYGPDMAYYNHYGDLQMMGYDDKPTDSYRPVLAEYRGKIYPVNRVHSAWPAIERLEGGALLQPKMGTIYKMWADHLDDATRYPGLAAIKDDNGDGVIEVNRAEEIDSLVSCVTQALRRSGYPLDDARVVWVSDERVYSSGTEFRVVEKRPDEASPYGNVHKYSHDVYPARAALGSKGCTDCHSFASTVLFGRVLQEPFDSLSHQVWAPQHILIGISRFEASLGAFREAILKPLVYGLLLFVGLLLAGRLLAFLVLEITGGMMSDRRRRAAPIWLSAVLLVGLGPMLLQEDVRAYALPSREWVDREHFLVAMSVIGLGIIGTWSAGGPTLPQEARQRRLLLPVARRLLSYSLAVAVLSGFLMQLRIGQSAGLVRYAHTMFDLALANVLLGVAIRLMSLDPIIAPAVTARLSKRNTPDSSRVQSVTGGGK